MPLRARDARATAPRGARRRAAAQSTGSPASDGRGAAGRRWALRRTNVQEAFAGEGNPHQEGVRVTYSGDEAVELRVVSGRVALLPAAVGDGARDGPPRWATGELVLEDGTRLTFAVRDDASGGQLGTRSAGAAPRHHGGLSGIDVPASS